MRSREWTFFYSFATLKWFCHSLFLFFNLESFLYICFLLFCVSNGQMIAKKSKTNSFSPTMSDSVQSFAIDLFRVSWIKRFNFKTDESTLFSLFRMSDTHQQVVIHLFLLWIYLPLFRWHRWELEDLPSNKFKESYTYPPILCSEKEEWPVC